MPIRINLLAESQALEELRRRDPVKRAIWIGGFFVALMLLWSGYLQARAGFAQRELTHLEARLAVHTNDYQTVIAHQKKFNDINRKLGALEQLTTNRFLNGSVLNALQLTTVDDVQLVSFRTEQSYLANEEVKGKTNEFGRLIPGKPASVTEKIALI